MDAAFVDSVTPVAFLGAARALPVRLPRSRSGVAAAVRRRVHAVARLRRAAQRSATTLAEEERCMVECRRSLDKLERERAGHARRAAAARSQALLLGGGLSSSKSCRVLADHLRAALGTTATAALRTLSIEAKSRVVLGLIEEDATRARLRLAERRWRSANARLLRHLSTMRGLQRSYDDVAMDLAVLMATNDA